MSLYFQYIISDALTTLLAIVTMFILLRQQSHLAAVLESFKDSRAISRPF